MIWGVYLPEEWTTYTIDGIMVKYLQNDILKKNVKQSTIKMRMSYIYMFQQENSSKHTAELKRQWLIWNIPK